MPMARSSDPSPDDTGGNASLRLVALKSTAVISIRIQESWCLEEETFALFHHGLRSASVSARHWPSPQIRLCFPTPCRSRLDGAQIG